MSRRRPRLHDGRADKGSRKWLQLAVSRCPDVINKAVIDALKLPPNEGIEWLSPVEEDSPQFKEYRDEEFLKRLGISLKEKPLKDFWPRLGPQWDGLARTKSGRYLLIEAKANIPEFDSTPSAASPRSLAKIQRALGDTKDFLMAGNEVDWSQCYYQYANRLAHLYLLKELNNVNAALVFVYFVGDTTRPEVEPVSRHEWEEAIESAHHALGLSSNSTWMRENVFDVFIDVKHLEHIPWP